MPLLKVKYFFCVNKNHSFKKYKTVSLQNIVTQKMIIHLPSQYIYNKIFDYAGLKPKAINASNTLLIKEMLLANGGVGFSSHSAKTFKNFVEFGGDVIDIPLEENIVGEIGLLVKKNISLNQDIKIFLDFIEKELAVI